MRFLTSLLTLAGLASASPVQRQNFATIPAYIKTYAPLLYLYSGERFNPSDLQTHLNNVVPQVNFQTVPGPNPLTTSNLDQLNSNGGGTNVYLTSKTDVSKYPSWLFGNKPDASGHSAGQNNVVIVVDKGSGTVDAFYMYFYSFDYGGIVLSKEVGDHVGDWEHNMIRFKNGVPQAIWYSQHQSGEAFTYGTTSKSGVRPITYVANGTHANYATPGTHDHTLPGISLPGPLKDYTDKGATFDPLQSALFYSYSDAGGFVGADANSPTAFLNFNGQWGDKSYPNTDPRQDTLLGYPKYVDGPNGPKFKNLNRSAVCPNAATCIIRPFLTQK